jgi:hypothetical protein
MEIAMKERRLDRIAGRVIALALALGACASAAQAQTDTVTGPPGPPAPPQMVSAAAESI